MQSRFKDWGDVRIFLAVMREGSTLAAARVLGINQTTVARRIDVLEHVLEVALFEKTSRGATPTNAALNLLPSAEALESAAKAFSAKAVSERNRAIPPIRITSFDQSTMGNIGAVIAEFLEDNPNITIEFIAAERILNLAKGEADIALRMTPAITDDRLVARKIGRTQWTYYASGDYQKKHGTPEALSQDMTPHRVALLGHIASDRENVLRCASIADLQMAIRTGQAIGPLPVYEGDRDPELVRCFDPPEGADLPVWLVISPEAHKRDEVRRFTAFAAPKLSKKLKLELG